MAETRDLDFEEVVGWRPEVLHLYSTKESDGGSGTLKFTAAEPPGITSKRQLANDGAKTTDRTRTFGIVHRHRVERDRTRAYSVEIQHQKLKELLSEIFEGYLDLDPKAPLLKFSPGFEPFVHRWGLLLAADRAERDEDGKAVLQALIRTLSQELQSSFRVYHEFETTGYIDFANILLAYKPGDVIVRSKDGILCAGMLKNASKVKLPGLMIESLELKVAVLDWDGDRRGFRQETWIVSFFEGIKRVSDLVSFPLDTHSERAKIRVHLTKRGEVFDSLCGRHLRTFQGHVRGSYDRTNLSRDSTIYVSLCDFVQTQEASEHISPLTATFFSGLTQLSERVIVDTKAFHHFSRKSKAPLAPLSGDKDTILSALSMNERQHPTGNNTQEAVRLPPLTEVEKMVAVPKVRGFALENKAWYEFNIQSLAPISWNYQILENLVLEPEEKKLLLALKLGKGMILLLGGSPGVGKTLTAEAVAENLQRPLYRVRAGDLGVDAHKVESSLKQALEHCAYWNAVLLIDEADAFLAQRTSENLAQNELVSVFLVLLEYYKGVLILTTNRTDCLDAAFESRIDIVLSYRDLTSSARRKIWSNFVRTLPPDDVQLSPEDLTRLSQWVLNGRQIKSAIKTARILASQDKTPLQMRHLEVVLQVRRKGTKLLTPSENGQTGAEGILLNAYEMLRWCLSWLLSALLFTVIWVAFAHIGGRKDK